MRSRLIDALPRVRSIRPVLTLLDPVVVLLAALVLPTFEPTPVVAAAVAMLLVCRAAGLQRSRLVLSVLDDLPHLVLGTIIATLALGGVSMDLRIGLHQRADIGPVALFALVSLAGCVLLRTAVYALIHVLRRNGLLAHPVLIVGTGANGRRLADALTTRREYGLVPVGMVDAGGDRASLRGLSLPLVADVGDLEQAMTDLGVDDVIFAEPGEATGGPVDQDTVAALRECVRRDRQVFVVPRFCEVLAGDLDRHTEVILDIAVTRLPRAAVPPYARVGRRAADVVVSLAGLVVLAPVLVLIAIAVRLETGPGVIFHQTRVGEGGRTFTLLKFRSLRPAAFGADTTTWSIDNDSRIGRVGRFLRRTGLDELPQLVNVLRGEASLVGPRRAPAARPARPSYAARWRGRERQAQRQTGSLWRAVVVRSRSLHTPRSPEVEAGRQLQLIARDERPRAAGRPATDRDSASPHRG